MNNMNKLCIFNGIAIIVFDIVSISDHYIRHNKAVIKDFLQYPKTIASSTNFFSNK